MADLPKFMIAIDPAAPGGAEVLVPVERPVPQPGAGELLIRVAAAGVNRPEIMQREGRYPPPPGAPSILGMEMAGVVVALGDGVDPGLLGSKVCALVAGGTYAEYAVAPASLCLPVPDALTLIEAGAMPETLLTVWGNVFHRGHAQAGEKLLVHGGTSGIGTMAILLGRLFDLEVIVTAGSAEKCARALEIGAAHAIDYRALDFVEEVRAITGGEGVQMVLDMVGGDYIARNLKCLAPEGRHISIAAQQGGEATVPLWPIMRNRLTLTGSTLRARELAYKALLTAEVAAKVWPYAAAGDLKPIIDRTFPLPNAADAHRHLESGDNVGKTVLVMEA